MCSYAARDGTRQSPCPLGRPSDGPDVKRLLRSARSFLRDRRREERPLPDCPAGAFGCAKATPPGPPQQKQGSARKRFVKNQSMRTAGAGPTDLPFARPAPGRSRSRTVPGSPAVRVPTQRSCLRDRTSRCRGSSQRRAGIGPPARRRPVISGRRTDAAKSLHRSRPARTSVAPSTRRGARNPAAPQRDP